MTEYEYADNLRADPLLADLVSLINVTSRRLDDDDTPANIAAAADADRLYGEYIGSVYAEAQRYHRAVYAISETPIAEHIISETYGEAGLPQGATLIGTYGCAAHTAGQWVPWTDESWAVWRKRGGKFDEYRVSHSNIVPQGFFLHSIHDNRERAMAWANSRSYKEVVADEQ